MSMTISIDNLRTALRDTNPEGRVCRIDFRVAVEKRLPS